MYLACLEEFERLDYDDKYVAEIRHEVERIRAGIRSGGVSPS